MVKTMKNNNSNSNSNMTLVNAEIINLTPHDVNVVAEDGSPIATFPSKGIARAAQQDVPVVTNNAGVEIVRTQFGATVDLPAPEEGKLFIVSIITVSAARAEGRPTDDLLITSTPVRDEAGRIVGCRRLAIQ